MIETAASNRKNVERFPIEPIDKKFEHLGGLIIEIDGKIWAMIIDALDKSDSVKKTDCHYANTIKGKGILR
jgi:transketolase N-terminal domain/subunit